MNQPKIWEAARTSRVPYDRTHTRNENGGEIGLSNATKFSSYEFSGLDELLAVADKLPVAETKSLAKFPRAAETWRNAGDYKAVFSGESLWQISGKTYTVVQHAALIKAVVSQLAELGLDSSYGRVDTWNEEGRIWITALSPPSSSPWLETPTVTAYSSQTATTAALQSAQPTTLGGRFAKTACMLGRRNWRPEKFMSEAVASAIGFGSPSAGSENKDLSSRK